MESRIQDCLGIPRFPGAKSSLKLLLYFALVLLFWEFVLTPTLTVSEISSLFRMELYSQVKVWDLDVLHCARSPVKVATTRFNLTYTYTIRKGRETAFASDLWQSLRREFNFKSYHSLIRQVLNERNTFTELLKTFKYSRVTHEPINFRAITRSETFPTHVNRQKSSLIWWTVLAWLKANQKRRSILNE